jgi:8-oxo-dGTP pyrophosphatase MutT (NUDIX family)
MGKKQYAALPFRIRQSGLRIMLITTRKKGRWSIPKGSPISSKKPHQTAAVEAYEEAGLIGAVKKARVGKYKHKRTRGDAKQIFEVSVFPMKVRGQDSWWPEKGERKAIWVSPNVAAELVHKEQLKQLISRFAARFKDAKTDNKSL